MAFVRSPKGVIGQVPDDEYEHALKMGYTAVPQEELAAEQRAADDKAEAGKHPIQSAAEGAFTGAVDAFTAIPRAASALGAVIDRKIGTDFAPDPLAGMTGANALAGVKSIAGDPLLQQTQQQNNADTQQYMQGVNQRAAANPLAHGAGTFAGGLVGMAPGMAVGKAAGGALEAAGAGKSLAAFGEGAAFGAPQAVADAAAEADRQKSELTGAQALAYGGLGGLFAGTFNFVGKKAEALWAARSSAEAAGGTSLEAIPNLEVHGGKTTPVNPHAESDLMGMKRGKPEVIPEVPDLEAPVTGRPRAASAADLDLAAAPEKASWKISDDELDATFRRKERYSPGQRDLTTGAAEDTDLPLGGRPGADIHPEELRIALSGEDINSRNRVAYVKKLIQPIPEGATPEWVMNMSEEERIALADYTGALKYTSSGKPIPPSDTTWKALADALADREGYTAGPASPAKDLSKLTDADGMKASAKDATHYLFNDETGSTHMAELTAADKASLGHDMTPTAHTDAAEAVAGGPAPYEAKQGGWTPSMGIGDQAEVGLGGGPIKPGRSPFPVDPLEAAPDLPSSGAPAKPYEPTAGGWNDAMGTTQSETAIGTKLKAASAPLPPDAAEGHPGWKGFLKSITRYSARRAIGSTIGGVIGGGAFGPVGWAAGQVGGWAGTAAYEKMPALAAKAAKLANAAITAALWTGSKAPPGTAILAGLKTGEAFLGKSRTPEAAYQARTRELQALNNPETLAEKVGNAFGPLAHTERGAIAAVSVSAQRGIEYLLQHAPTSPPDANSLTPLASRPTPNRSDISDFARVYNAVMYPTTVLSDIRHGLVTKDQIDAIKYVHPQWYQENIVNPVLAKMREHDAEMEPFNPAQRRTIDTLLGIQTGVDEAKFADHYAPLFAKAVAAQSQPAEQQKDDGSSGRKLGKRSVISSNYLNQTSKMLGVDSP